MSKEREHKCLLLQPADDVLKLQVDSGILIDLRRRWFRFCMISIKHPKTSAIYKSESAIRNEEYKHMVYFMMMIHPFSLCSLYWEFWMFLVYTYNLLIMTGPFGYTGILIIMRFVGDLLIYVDMFKHFFTGYYSHDHAKSIMHPSCVAKSYLKFYFWVDILSCLMPLVVPFHLHRPTQTTKTAITIARFLGLMKILRLPRWSGAVDLFQKYKHIRTYKLSIVKLSLTYVLLVCWLYTLVFYLVGSLVHDLVDLPWTKRFLMVSFYIMVVSFGEINAKLYTMRHILIGIFAIVVGYCLQMYLIAKVMQIWVKFSSGRNKNEQLLQQFQEYVKYKALPPTLRERIFKYFDFKYQTEYFNEERINSMAAVSLRKDMLVHTARKYMRKVKLLRSFPKEAIFRIMGKMKSEIYLPDDTIVKCGKPRYSMFFIYYGTVAVYSPSGKELCHLEDGEHFGEITLLFPVTRVASVIAVTACEIFRIRKADFLNILTKYPNLRKKMYNLAYRRLLKVHQGKSW